jgi:hypothetical protein
MEGLKKDTRKIKYFLMKMLRTVHATTCRTFSILSKVFYSNQLIILHADALSEEKVGLNHRDCSNT